MWRAERRERMLTFYDEQRNYLVVHPSDIKAIRVLDRNIVVHVDGDKFTFPKYYNQTALQEWEAWKEREK